MKKIVLLALSAALLTMVLACENQNGNPVAYSSKGRLIDTTLCQFNNIKLNKMYMYHEEGGDTTFYENTFTALWPTTINGRPCDELQHALLRAMTDSAGLDQFDKVVNFLMDPNSDNELDSKCLTPVNAIPDNCEQLSTSEFHLAMQTMTDRLLTYHLSTYDFMAGAAHGTYTNNYVTYDLQAGKAVSLEDIIADTTLLRTATLKAIESSYHCTVNDLSLPDNGLLPLPHDFYIEDNVLHAVYQVYEIASYAQGAFDAPIYPYMLKNEEMKRLYTPYGLELLELHDLTE